MKSPLLSRCMCCNISHLLQILHSVSTQDMGFLCRSQSKHILGMDEANDNIFTEQTCPTANNPNKKLIQSINHHLRHWHYLQPPDTVWRSVLTEGGRHECSPHSCRSLWWCTQYALPLTAKNIPGEKITREGASKMQKLTERKWETENV